MLGGYLGQEGFECSDPVNTPALKQSSTNLLVRWLA